MTDTLGRRIWPRPRKPQPVTDPALIAAMRAQVLLNECIALVRQLLTGAPQ